MSNNDCPHVKDWNDKQDIEKHGHASMFCETCKAHVSECQIEIHVCDMRRIYVCSDHVDEQIKHAERLLGKRPLVKDTSVNLCDFYDKEYGKPGREWADGFHHNPCYSLTMIY